MSINPEILIVDDDPVTLLYVGKVLSRRNFSYDTASSGIEAIDKIKKHNFNILLTDLGMPEMSGDQLISKIKEFRPETVSIIMSAGADVENLLATLNENKAYSYLIKPLNPERLYHVLDSAFEYFLKLQKADLFTISEKKLYKNILETFDWKNELYQKQVSSIATDTIRQINISFSHGSGLGSLISSLSLLFAMAKESGTENQILIPNNVFNVVKSNYESSIKMMDCFSEAQKIIMDNEQYTSIGKVAQISELAFSAKEKLESIAELRKHKISLGQLPRNISEKNIILNQEKLNIVFYELLLNAMKYSRPSDQIYILFFLRDKFLEVKFLNPAYENSDGTVGIVGKNEKNVFEPFYRISSVMDEEFEKFEIFSYGLGLTIVKKIMELHAGGVFIYTVRDFAMDRINAVDVCITLKFPVLD